MVECIECEREASSEENRIVTEVAGGYGPICNQCWSEFLRQETVLAPREADVAALMDMDLSHREIGRTLGIEKSTVDTVTIRVRGKIEKAQRTRDELQHLVGE